MIKKKPIMPIFSNLVLSCTLVLLSSQPVLAANYTKAKAWAQKPAVQEQPVDVFYLTSSAKKDDPALKKNTAVYSTVGDVYAPTFKKAKDAKKAFTTYLEAENKNRPYILAASPDQANLAVTLYDSLSPEQRKNVIAAYAPGATLKSQPQNLKNSKKSKKDNSEVEDSSSKAGTTHAMRKRMEALMKKNAQEKKAAPRAAKPKAPVSKVVTILPKNFEHSLLENTENFLEQDKPYYKALTRIYSTRAKGFLDEIKSNMKVRDYNLKLRRPRNIRLYTRDIVIHHSGTPTDMDLSAPAIQNMHLHNGWLGIGYHFVIRKNGTVEVGSPLETIGAHAYMHNANTIGIHLSGNFEIGRPTKAQINSTEKLIAYLAKDYKLDLNKNLIWGHRHYNHDTACPGEYLNNLLPQIRKGARAYEAKLLGTRTNDDKKEVKKRRKTMRQRLEEANRN